MASIQPTLEKHAQRAEAAAQPQLLGTEHNMYRCAALDLNEAAMADWRLRDAHEFALGAALGFSFFLDALLALGGLLTSLGAFNPDSVTLFLVVFAGAACARMLVYALFVAARWQPPAVACRCVTIVPAAVFRLLALTGCLAYATSSACSALAEVPDLRAAFISSSSYYYYSEPSASAVRETTTAAEAVIAGGTAAVSDEDDVLQGAVGLLLHALQALLNVFASFVVVHRLWLQSTEDERAWLVVRKQHWLRGASPRPSPRVDDGPKGMV